MKLFNLISTLYKNFTSTIQSYLSKVLEGDNINFSNNTVFGLLVNVINSISQNIMLYIEDAFTEQNKFTAVRKKSIYGLAALSGYQPSLGKASGVQIKLEFKPSNYPLFNIVLRNQTPLTCTLNGLTYNLILPQDVVVISADNNNSKILYAVEGHYESQRFISSGGLYYTQTFKTSSNIDLDYFEVRINNEPWAQVASIYDMKPNGKEYVVQTSYTDGVDIIFGNDRYGKSLHDGDVIETKYLVHSGEAGNIDSTQDMFFVFQNMLFNTVGEKLDGNQIFNLTLANKEAVTSGTDSESTEHVKKMIGYNTRSLVLASPENYKSFISNFSFCGYNRTWAEQNIMLIKSLIIKNYKLNINKGIKYFDLKPEDFVLTPLLKASIINSIRFSGRQLAGVTYLIVDPILCKYAIYVYVKLKKNNTADKDYLTDLIKNEIGDFFCNVENDMFIPKSDIIYKLKSNITDIDGVTIHFISERNERALREKYYDKLLYIFNPITNQYEIKKESVKILPGENPNLGLDRHGNIILLSDEEFPVLMGGWGFFNENDKETKDDDNYIAVIDPVTVIFE